MTDTSRKLLNTGRTMKALTVNMHPASGQTQPLIYQDVKTWAWDDKYVHVVLEDDDTTICLNSTYVIGVVWKDELEPEQAELWDVDDDDTDD